MADVGNFNANDHLPPKYRVCYLADSIKNTSQINRYQHTLRQLADRIHAYNTPEKMTGYLVRGDCTYRNDASMTTVEWLFIDGDGSLSNLNSAPDPFEVHELLIDYGYNHLIYPSYSNGLDKVRWRVMMPANDLTLDNWKVGVNHLIGLLQQNEIDIKPVQENEVLSQPWFITGPTDEQYRWPPLVYDRGQDYSIPADFIHYELKYPVIQKDGKISIHTGSNLPKFNIEQAKINLEYGESLHPSAMALITRGWQKEQIIEVIQSGQALKQRGEQRINRLLNGELDEMIKWVDQQQNPKEDFPSPTPDNKTDLSCFEVSMEYVNKLEDKMPLYTNLLLSNHVATYIAMSGGGKTTILYFHVAPMLAADGLTVYYIDADSPPSDHKRMKEFADRHGFKFLNPDANIGTNAEQLIEVLKGYANNQHDLTDNVFIFDTLKKFANLMNKDDVKVFFKLARKLTSLGATIVLLGHANKYKDKDGNLIFEGVNDVRSDSDELIFLEAVPDQFGGLNVTTVVDPLKGAKVRGIFEPISFHISEDREVKLLDNAIKLGGSKKEIVPDLDIIEETEGYLAAIDEPVKQKILVSHVGEATGVGRDRVTRVINRNSALEGSDTSGTKRFKYRRGDKHTYLYLPILKN